MKSNHDGLGKKVLTLALFAVSVSPGARAEDEDSAKPSPGFVELGVQNVSKSSAKFGEYNGLNKSGLGVLGNFSLRGGNAYDNIGGTTRWSLYGTDLGVTSRELGGEYGNQGSWRLGFRFDQLRHNLSNNYQTPYIGTPGGNTFVLPTGFGVAPGASSLGLTPAQLSTFHNLDIFSERRNSALNGVIELGPRWNIKFDVGRQEQSGAKLQGFGLSPIGGVGSAQYVSILPMPTQYRTDTANFSLSWNGDKGHFSGAYYGSYFHDGYDRVTFQSWSGANVMNTMSTPPGNMFHQVSLNGGYLIAARTRLTGNLSYSVNTQNQAFAYDPGLMVTPSPLGSANARVNTTHADLKLTNQSIKDLTLSATAKYDERDNRTPSNIYNFNAISGADTANYPNTPLSIRKSNYEMTGDYRIKRDHHIRLAVSHEDVSRWCNNYAVNAGYPAGTNCVVARSGKDDKADLGYRLNAFDSVVMRIGYGWSNRRVDADPYARAAFIGTNGVVNGVTAAGQNAGDFLGFHPVLDATRIQHAIKASAAWDVNEQWALGASGRYTHDGYKTMLGVQRGISWSANLDATYRYDTNGSVTAFVTQLYRDRSMTDQQRTFASASAATATAIAVPAGATWNDKLTDKDLTIGLGLKHTGLLAGKLDLAGDATYSWAVSSYLTQFNYSTTTTTGLTCAAGSILSCGSTPDVKTTISQLKLTGTYKIDKQSKLALRFLHQRLSGADYYYNGYQFGYTPTQILPTNQQLGTHVVNFVALSYVYNF